MLPKLKGGAIPLPPLFPGAPPLSKPILPTDHDFDVMARTIFGEARGEPYEGQIAVAHVILNRWRSGRWFSRATIEGTCLVRLQFSCWNHDDPTYRRITTVGTEELAPFIQIAKDAYDNTTLDPTDGATHYYADTIKEPLWAEGKTPTIKIGHHSFFKGID